MSQSAQQIAALACQIARTKGMTAQAGQLLNVILQELAQTYDFAVARKVTTITLNPQLTSPNYGSGPYALPSDYLRAVIDGVFWTQDGVPYHLIPIDLTEFDAAVLQAGVQSLPYWWTTDMSASPPAAYVYPPPNGAYVLTVRYFAQMADIATPESSAVVPWFPNQNYLITRLAGELMKIANDDRKDAYLGEGPSGAQGILDRYLQLKDDKSNRARTIKLDKRYFGPRILNLPNTKAVGF